VSAINGLPLPDLPILELLVVVALAYAVQTATGFGSALVGLTLGSLLLPLPDLLALFVPLSLLQTGYLALRHHTDVDWRWLLRRVLPAMAAGSVVGFAIASAAPTDALGLGFAVLILSISLLELARPSVERPPAGAEMAALVGAGVMHGAVATGGPLLVWAAARRDLAPATFRASLWTVWLVMNILLTAQYLRVGWLTAEELPTLGLLAFGIPVGIAVGRRAQPLIAGPWFRRVVFGILALASLASLARSAAAAGSPVHLPEAPPHTDPLTRADRR